MTATKDKQQIKCLPIGSNGRPAGIAQEYGTTPSTAFDRQEQYTDTCWWALSGDSNYHTDFRWPF